MKKLTILLLFLYSLSLFGCTAPVEPTEPTETNAQSISDVGCLSELRIEDRDFFYKWHTNASNDLYPPPANMILFDNVNSIAAVEMFVRPFGSNKDNYYYRYTLFYGFAGTLYCYHDGAQNVISEEDPPYKTLEPASISVEMTDMARIPTNENKKQVISRNGFRYVYTGDGHIEAIEWYMDNIRLRLVFKKIDFVDLPNGAIRDLLSTDDDVAFAAMDEIIDKLSNRQPNVPQETTAESTSAQ